jgi:Ca2+-transporting ATPase
MLRELVVDKETGLGEEDARRRLEKFGPNALQRGSREGPLRLLWRQINNPLIYVLLGCAALAVALGKTADGTVVLGVVVLNAVVGFVQEYRAGKAIECMIRQPPGE